jgi:predicted dithiol-disulfide oxidoreductase (DUF899 family)
MWHEGHTPAEQCEGCTFYTTQVGELSNLHSRDISFAVLCQGPYDESARYRDFMGLTASSRRTGRSAAASRRWTTTTH